MNLNAVASANCAVRYPLKTVSLAPAGIGWKTHSGWAVIVALGKVRGEVHLIERRLVELVDEANCASGTKSRKAALQDAK
jgi:hypothetical protein